MSETEDSTTAAEPLGSISGEAFGPGGEILPAPSGQFCGPVVGGSVGMCWSITETDQGNFDFDFPSDGTESGMYNFKWVHPEHDGTLFGLTRQMVSYELGEHLVVSDPFYVPRIASFVDIGTEGVHEVDMSSGLVVTVDASEAGTDWGFTTDYRAGGVRVPESDWPITEHEGQSVLALWAMVPFTGHAAEGSSYPFALNDSLGLGPGNTVNFYELEKDTGALLAAGTGTVAADGDSIEVDGGLHALTWLVVTAG